MGLRVGVGAVALAAALAVSQPALSQDAMLSSTAPWTGYYYAAKGGAQSLNDSRFAGGAVSAGVDYDTGGVLLGVLGYRFDSGTALEAEAGWRSNGVDGLSGTASGSDGHVRALSLMVNATYSPQWSAERVGRLRPYIGAGIGMADLDFNGIANAGAPFINDSHMVLAYQGFAGVEMPLSDRASASMEYRYFATADADLTTAGGVGVDGEYASHALLVGFTIALSRPVRTAAAPQVQPQAQVVPQAVEPVAEVVQPVVEPAPPPVFLVFFDWDQAVLTAGAEAVLADALDLVQQDSTVRLVLAGHADRSGTDIYNLALSQRRAEAVAAWFAARGVSREVMTLQALGESSPLVATADGVREPQNRRVEILFQ
ncbi:MAG: OmpA family protein [Alphaproteobacteria bacterium]